MSRPPPNGYRAMSNGSQPQLHMSSSNSAMNSQSRLGTPQQQRPPSSSGASRAERFEDEKRRIIESCFNKTDANGQLSESYITHIRIQEDSAHPSSPAPPDSPPENRKPRLIIIAVRSTGRVRMHKARENNNGSFSIGKTWNLEELSAIESFSNSSLPPKDDREAQYRSWAGGFGFIVTITKPYYWQAGSAKEKDFFIASAVKIYRKYTKGLVPELRGFDDHNQAMVLGAPPGQQPQGPPAPSPRLPSGDVGSPTPPQPPFAQGSRPSSREDPRMRNSPGPPQNQFGQRPPESPARGPHPQQMQQGRPGHPSPVPRSKPSSERMRSKSREPSRPGMRSGPSPAPAPGRAPPSSSGHSNGPNSQRSQSHLRSESPAVSAVSSGSREAAPPALQPRSQSPPKQRSFDRSGSNAPRERHREPSHNEANGATAGAAAGAALLSSTRQRWQQQQQEQQQPDRSQQPPQPPQQPPQPPQHKQQQPAPQPPVHRKQPSVSQLPPLETSQSNRSASSQPRTNDRQPTIPQSGASSAGVDPSDAAAISGMNSFYGPEPTTPAEPPTADKPSSPLTPERSRRRPQFDTRASEASVDLRPPPLKQSGRQPDGGSHNATPEPSSIVNTPHDQSAVSTPAREEPPDVKPLAVQKPSETNIKMPGAFVPSPQGPSPLATPAETPTAEKEQAEAEGQSTPEPEGESQTDDTYRPGLGPMVKKRPGAADRFRKAAFAANAFKPRPGGAAERILKAKQEKENGGAGEADGITGVFRAAPQQKEEPAAPPPISPKAPTESSSAPTLEVTAPVSPLRMPSSTMRGDTSVQLTDGGPVQPPEPLKAVEPTEPETTPEEFESTEERQLRAPQVKIKRRSLQQEKYLGELGIDKALLEGKGLDFESLLLDFGWGTGARQPKQIADFESDIKRQLGRVEAGSWLSQHDNAREDKVAHVEGLLDKAIAECDELEGLLTLYSVELGSLNEDIRFIEAQSQGLQVQSANQQLLHTELTGLIDTISLDRSVLEPLRYSDIADPAGLEEVEMSLVKLYQAMVTMDPSVRSTTHRPKSRLGGDDGTELSRMAALREKKAMYERESNLFCQRLMQHLDYAFTSALNNAKGQTMKLTGDGTMSRLNKDAFTHVRTGLWVYSPLVLFTKELNMPAWQTVLRIYYSRAKTLYADTFKENFAGWKRAARKPTGEEAELLFTHIEKEAAEAGGSGLGSTARKMTIKRSQTLAKTLRNATNDKRTASDSRNQGSSLMACEVFAGAMDEMAPLISQEQNFVVDYFHATSLETSDFVDVVSSNPPERRRGTNLLTPKPMDPDREMARRVTGVMDEVFSFFTQETSILLDWAVSSDPIQGVGILAALSKHSFYLAETGQEYLLQLLDQLSMRLQTLFAKFVDDQIRAIEETKVKHHKRKGVIAFIRIFPQFSAAVENVFASVARGDYDGPGDSVMEVRRLVDDAYARINSTMFDSLKVIAKESPTAGAPASVHNAAARQTGMDEDNDKHILNHHVLMIENMNHYIEEVDDGGREGVLSEWRGRAMVERQEALEAYVGQVVRRPLGKLLDYIDSLESALASNGGNPAAITTRTTFTRKNFRHLLKEDYTNKEVRKNIDLLRRRIEKHFGEIEGESAHASRNLVNFVCAEVQKFYEGTLERTQRLIRTVYPVTEGEKNVEVDFTKEDIKSGFRR